MLNSHFLLTVKYRHLYTFTSELQFSEAVWLKENLCINIVPQVQCLRLNVFSDWVGHVQLSCASGCVLSLSDSSIQWLHWAVDSKDRPTCMLDLSASLGFIWVYHCVLQLIFLRCNSLNMFHSVWVIKKKISSRNA